MDTRDDTNRLHLLTDGRSLFPGDFIDAIRKSVDAGLTSEQITAVILLSTSVLDVKDVDGLSLVGRTKEVAMVIQGLNSRNF